MPKPTAYVVRVIMTFEALIIEPYEYRVVLSSASAKFKYMLENRCIHIFSLPLHYGHRP